MNLKARLIAINIILFFISEIISWLSVEGPMGSIFHLSLLEFLQPLMTCIVSITTVILVFLSPTQRRKYLFILIQSLIIIFDICVLVWFSLYTSSKFVDLIDEFARAIFILIIFIRLYFILLVAKLHESKL